MKKPILNYDQKLSYKSEWYKYFGEYEYCVNKIFDSIVGGEINIVSLPLAFLIRHTLELGYKMNLIELEKVTEIKPKIEYKGKSAHKIDSLHYEFVNQMKIVFEKYNANNDYKKEFRRYNSKLNSLKRLIHKLDELSHSFRYPVKNDGITPNFDSKDPNDKTDVINFKEIKELFDESIILIKYSTDVVEKIIQENENCM